MNRIARKLGNKLQWFLYFVICRFGFHKWEMTKWCRFKDQKCKYLVEEGNTDVIMVGHILFPNIDTLPSTISSEILNKRLRENLGYDGILITDDMEMDSIESVGEYTDIAKQALLAGNDILMYSGIPQVQKDVYEYILQSISNGEITEEDIDKKVLRILKVKIKYGILNIESIQQFQEQSLETFLR